MFNKSGSLGLSLEGTRFIPLSLFHLSIPLTTEALTSHPLLLVAKVRCINTLVVKQNSHPSLNRVKGQNVPGFRFGFRLAKVTMIWILGHGGKPLGVF